MIPDGTILSHPLVTDVKLTFTKRLWSDWKGGLVGALMTFMLGLALPERFLFALFEHRLRLAGFIAPLVCFIVMAVANYTEHILSPPVKPRAIVSFSGKSVFFTVNVIFTLLLYFTLSLVANVLELISRPSPTLNYFTYAFFVPAYSLGTILSFFYYAGVLTDKAEAANIRRHHRRNIPLARYLHTTHSTSVICVNIDLAFKQPSRVCEHMPESLAFFVWVIAAYR